MGLMDPCISANPNNAVYSVRLQQGTPPCHGTLPLQPQKLYSPTIDDHGVPGQLTTPAVGIVTQPAWPASGLSAAEFPCCGGIGLVKPGGMEGYINALGFTESS